MDIYASLIFAGLAVSFLHAILPNHWLPFVLAGRAQRWSMGKTLSVVTLAGGGHVLITTALGVLIVWVGLKLSAYVEAWSGPLAAGVLVLLGLYYIVRYLRGEGHSHTHFPGFGHSHDHAHDRDHGHSHDRDPDEESHGRSFSPDTAAIASLIALLTFSPCEGFLPIYLTAWPYGWGAFAVLSVVLALGTLAGMLIFTGLTFAGVQRLQPGWLERYENLVLGGVLVLLGAAVAAFHL